MDNERILVVDDDEKICQILSLYLKSKGYDVSTCKNGANAISAFEEFKPDLVEVHAVADELHLLLGLRPAVHVERNYQFCHSSHPSLLTVIIPYSAYAARP